MLKHFVETLDEAPMEYRGAYVAQTAGGFRLHPTIAAEVDAHAAEVARIEADIAKSHALLRKLVTQSAVQKAMALHPIRDGLRGGVEALFAQQIPLSTREEADSYVAFVETPHGPVTVESALEGWLATEAGAVFLDRPAPAGDGPLAQQIKALRTVH